MHKSIILGSVASLIFSGTAIAHHSFFGRFDTGASIELEGEITQVSWRNPHVHILLKTIDDNREEVEWNLESGSPTLMRRAGIPPNSIKVGEVVRVAAYPPLTDKKEAFATNVLLSSGQELVLQTGAEAKFTDQFIGDFSYRFRTEGDRSRAELGLFRIWTFTGADGFLFPESINRDYDLNNYPMTPAALAALSSFNPATDNPTNNCTPKGMPMIMEQPLPMEVIDSGESILIRIEEYDLVRTIHMDQTKVPPNTDFSPLGYSIGRWDNETLVVTTTRVNWPHFNQAGIPLSTEVELIERFSAQEQGSEMAYELTIIDPVNFSKPVKLTKTWLYVPGVEILPFECREVQ